MESSTSPGRGLIRTNRPTFTQAQFEAAHRPLPPKQLSYVSQLKKYCACSTSCVRQSLIKKVPIVQTLRRYDIKHWLLNDFIAGISVGVIHIPQSLGFAILAGLPAQYGLYTSLFPTLVYFFFGTSHHLSIGTMAIMSLMTGAVIEREVPNVEAPTLQGGNDTEPGGNGTIDPGLGDFRVSIASSLSLMMGAWQLGLSFLNLGMIATFMSMTFIGGFMTGCAGHIITSQVFTLSVSRTMHSHSKSARRFTSFSREIDP